MTFEQWRKKHAWHVADEATIVFMRLAYESGADSVRAIKRKKMKAYYKRLVTAKLCTLCKRKCDGEQIQCSRCRKNASAKRKAAKE